MTEREQAAVEAPKEQSGGWTVAALSDVFADGQARGVRVWSPGPIVADVAAAAEAVRWRCVVVDTTGLTVKADIIDAFGRDFPLPSYLGHNWDALEEALGDVDPGTGAGFVVVWTGWADFSEADPDGFGTLLDICRAAARGWSKQVVGSAVTLCKPVGGLTSPQQTAVAAIPRLRPN
jgi:hypothetical protein